MLSQRSRLAAHVQPALTSQIPRTMKPQPNPVKRDPQRTERPRSLDRFHLLVNCRTEATQKRLYQQLTRKGLSCRPLVL